MTTDAARQSGLALYRAKLKEEHDRRMAEMEVFRKDATTEERDGRTYTVVRIPDRYGWTSIKERS